MASRNETIGIYLFFALALSFGSVDASEEVSGPLFNQRLFCRRKKVDGGARLRRHQLSL